MINLLILLSFGLLTMLIGIKYGALEVFATILSITALIPFIISTYLYLSQKPIITATIHSKVKYQIDDTYVYSFRLAIQCQKGDIILKNLYFEPEWGFVPTLLPPKKNSGTTEYSRMEYVINLDETQGINVFRLITDAKLHAKNGFDNPVGLQSKEDRDRLKIKLTIDTSVDPFKQGWLSVFPSIYNYRQRSEIVVDFTQISNDNGAFK